MFSYCFINVMEKIQSLESRTNQVDLGKGCVCVCRARVRCWPEAQLCSYVNAYLRRSTSQEPSEHFRGRI